LESYEKSKENWPHKLERARIHLRKRKAPSQEANCTRGFGVSHEALQTECFRLNYC